MPLTRRQVLALLVAGPAGAVAACTVETAPPQATTAGPTPAPHLSRSPLWVPPEPAPTLSAEASRWRPGPGEVSPEIKRTATAFLETAGTWRDGGAAVDNLLRAGASPAAAATASILQPPGARSAKLSVIYPQYGGLAADRAAVIALLAQTLHTAAGVVHRELAVDVRLHRNPLGDWVVEQLRPPTSLGTAIPITDTAAAVLTEPRIVLPGPAQADVRTGRMNDPVLRILLALSREFVLTIQVMHTGHIQTVYPTERVSNHAVGRAVDIREIDGEAVVDARPVDDRRTRLMRRAAELGATEVGGPVDLNGDRKGFFSDAVHQDHIHLGLTPGDPPAYLR